MVLHDTFAISRRFDVPPIEVFAAFADAEIKRRWFRLPGGDVTYELDFRVGGGETAGSTFTGLDTEPERLEYRSRFIDIVEPRRIVFSYESIVDGDLRWTSLVTVLLDADDDGTALEWTEQAAFLRYTGDGGADLAHLRGGSALRFNGLDAALHPESGRGPAGSVGRTFVG